MVETYKEQVGALLNVIRLSVSADWLTYHFRLLPSPRRQGDGALSVW